MAHHLCPETRHPQAARQATELRVDDLPLRPESIERLVEPRGCHCQILMFANGPLLLTILPSTNVRFEVIRRNV
jgi:hypothetical protein